MRRNDVEQEVIILCVRWYISYKLSYRDVGEMMAERGVAVAHTTLLRWTQCYVPEFEKRWMRFARPVGCSWRMDETYIKVRAEWVYLYRAVVPVLGKITSVDHASGTPRWQFRAAASNFGSLHRSVSC